MELRHLRYFVTVAEELNFRKAAERLSVSRPALSKQVKDLEEEIEVRLLERDTVKVSLTKAGEVFLEDARRILLLSRKAVDRAVDAQSGHRGRLRIGSVGAIATDFLPETLKTFYTKFPGVEVSLVEMLNVEQFDALANGRIDIGFGFGKDLQSMDWLNSLCVIRSEFGLAVPTQHPLARQSAVRLSEIEGEAVLCIANRQPSPHREAIHRICAYERVKPTVIREIEGFDSLITMIAADQGVSFIPVVMDLEKQGVAIVPILSDPDWLAFQMFAVWRRESPSALVRSFVALLEAHVEQH